jgi:hypothetical protein
MANAFRSRPDPEDTQKSARDRYESTQKLVEAQWMQEHKTYRKESALCVLAFSSSSLLSSFFLYE